MCVWSMRKEVRGYVILITPFSATVFLLPDYFSTLLFLWLIFPVGWCIAYTVHVCYLTEWLTLLFLDPTDAILLQIALDW